MQKICQMQALRPLSPIPKYPARFSSTADINIFNFGYVNKCKNNRRTTA